MNAKPIAFITGAAQGIGRAAALEFARRGYDLALLDAKENELARTSKLVAENGGASLLQPGDLADLTFIKTSIVRTMDRFGRIDVLVNNAAWREVKTMCEISIDSWEKTLRVCLTAPAFLAKYAAEAMEKKGSGVIINISSIRAIQPDGMAAAYVAAKGGLDALTRELAILLGPRGIRVVGLSPGAVASGLSLDIVDEQGRSVTEQLRQTSEEIIPLKRWGTVEETARVIAMLAGDEASYITGTTIVMDGGLLANGSPYSAKKLMKPTQFP